jgi:hypothetical protein
VDRRHGLEVADRTPDVAAKQSFNSNSSGFLTGCAVPLCQGTFGLRTTWPTALDSLLFAQRRAHDVTALLSSALRASAPQRTALLVASTHDRARRPHRQRRLSLLIGTLLVQMAPPDAHPA